MRSSPLALYLYFLLLLITVLMINPILIYRYYYENDKSERCCNCCKPNKHVFIGLWLADPIFDDGNQKDSLDCQSVRTGTATALFFVGYFIWSSIKRIGAYFLRDRGYGRMSILRSGGAGDGAPQFSFIEKIHLRLRIWEKSSNVLGLQYMNAGCNATIPLGRVLIKAYIDQALLCYIKIKSCRALVHELWIWTSNVRKLLLPLKIWTKQKHENIPSSMLLRKLSELLPEIVILMGISRDRDS